RTDHSARAAMPSRTATVARTTGTCWRNRPAIGSGGGGLERRAVATISAVSARKTRSEIARPTSRPGGNAASPGRAEPAACGAGVGRAFPPGTPAGANRPLPATPTRLARRSRWCWLGLTHASARRGGTAMHDLVIRNGTVVDGSGAPARQADIAVDGEQI